MFRWPTWPQEARAAHRGCSSQRVLAAGASPGTPPAILSTVLNMPKAGVLTDGLVQEVWQRQQAQGVPSGRCVEHDTGEVGVGRVPQNLDNLRVNTRVLVTHKL